MKKIMADEEGVVVEYIEVRHPETLDELAEIGPDGAVAAVAARVGGTRLIDNRVLGPGAGPAALSRR
jgi:pantoate--beta-alanine ligase